MSTIEAILSWRAVAVDIVTLRVPSTRSQRRLALSYTMAARNCFTRNSRGRLGHSRISAQS